MAFADPQSVTINAVAQSLPRTGLTSEVGTFEKDDSSVSLVISKALGRRYRQSIRLNHRKVVPDSLYPDTNKDVSMSVTLVVDSPTASSGAGYTIAEKKQIVDALTAYLTASSGAKVTQLLGGEI